MKNAGGGNGVQVFVKVHGFGDTERHALNTVFRLSQQGPVSYSLWSPDIAAKAQVVLMDGESWEAGVELARPAFESATLVWVGERPPPQAWKSFSKPIRWSLVVDALDRLFSQPVSGETRPGMRHGDGGVFDIDFDVLESLAMAGRSDAQLLAGADVDLDFDDLPVVARTSQIGGRAPSGSCDQGDSDDGYDTTDHMPDEIETRPAEWGEEVPAVQQGPRVLLVDADRDTRLYLIAKLASVQMFNIDEATTSAEAKALLKTTPYRLVIVDVDLSDGSMSGWQLLTWMRPLRKTGQVKSLLAMTSRANWLTVLRGILAGASPVMAKPLHPMRLMRRIAQLWSSQSGA